MWSPSVRLLAAYASMACVVLACALLYQAQEAYVPYWDYARNLVFLDTLTRMPSYIHTWLSAVFSVYSGPYNFLPLLPIVPLTRLGAPIQPALLMATTLLYLLPTCWLLARFTLTLAGQTLTPIKLAALMGSLALWHPLLLPVLENKPDVSGLFFIVLFMCQLQRYQLEALNWKQCAGLGAMLALAAALRRPCLLLAASLLFALGFAALSTRRSALRPLMGIGFFCALFLLPLLAPAVFKVTGTNRFDAYAAWAYTGDLLSYAALYLNYFGALLLALAVIGIAALWRNPPNRFWALVLASQPLVLGILFYFISVPETHHFMLFAPAVGVLAVIGCLRLPLARLARPLGGALILLSSVLVLAPPALRPTLPLEAVLAAVRHPPQQRHDHEALAQLANHIEELTRDNDRRIGVLSSSRVMAPSLLQMQCLRSTPAQSWCRRIVKLGEVDRRDGFPHKLTQADILVLASPAQLHLGLEHQQILAQPIELLESGRGLGAAYTRLTPSYALDDGVTAQLYLRNRPITAAELEALRQSLLAAYPGRADLFGPQEND